MLIRAPSARVSTLEITVDRVVPQPVGATITWVARAVGGQAPYQYKWLLFNGSRWEVVQNWSGSQTFRWTPAFANARYRVAVWVRSAGNTADEFEAKTEAAFAIDAGAPASGAVSERTPPVNTPVSTVTLTVDKSSSQPPGTTIVWTASATGGGAGRQYKWFVYDGNGWKSAAPWSTSETFVWTPEAANARYRIAVWARSADSVSDYFEACAEVGFAIEERLGTIAAG